MNGLIVATATSDWVSAISTLAAVAVALVVVVFGDELRTWRRKPELSVRSKFEPPFAGITEIHYGALKPCKGWYVKIEVVNQGKSAAQNVEVHVLRILRETEPGLFVEESDFTTLPLAWSYLSKDNAPLTVLPRLAQKGRIFCDLFRIVDPVYRAQLGNKRSNVGENSSVTSLCTVPKPSSHINVLPPGTFRLDCTVTADGVEPLTFQVLVKNTGRWDESLDSISRQVEVTCPATA